MKRRHTNTFDCESVLTQILAKRNLNSGYKNLLKHNRGCRGRVLRLGLGQGDHLRVLRLGFCGGDSGIERACRLSRAAAPASREADATSWGVSGVEGVAISRQGT